MANVPAYFSTVFGRSPFRDLQQHVSLCVTAARELQILFPAAHEGRWDDVEQSYDRITEIENEADAQKRGIRSNLPRGFFLPVARADLLDLLGVGKGGVILVVVIESKQGKDLIDGLNPRFRCSFTAAVGLFAATLPRMCPRGRPGGFDLLCDLFD